MSRLLTIAIPTYNRAAKLDRQLAWLERSLRGHESQCDLILSDNASPDDTPAVCTKWRDLMAARGIDLRINRMPQNVGALPNIARCVELARSRFTWVIGDDDEIADAASSFVLARLVDDPELASIVLNFQGTGITTYARCFNLEHDLLGDGRAVMRQLLSEAYWGLAFMTAQVYRTAFAQAALRAWPDGRGNFDYQVFLTAYAGAQGRVLATRDAHVTYVTGDNVYERDKRVALGLYADSLEVFVHLYRDAGYDAALCRRVARRHLWGLKKRFVNKALVNNPLLTARTVARASWYVAQLATARPARSSSARQPG
jgi:glycosyltransferase involved in cell wall biosynthesis